MSIARRCAAIAGAANGAGDLDAAIADLHRLPADLPGRGTLAAGLISAMVRPGAYPGTTGLRHLDGLLDIADRDPPAMPQWPRQRAAARAMALMYAAAEQKLSDPRAALAELEVLAADAGAGDDPRMEMLFDVARGGLRFGMAFDGGDEASLRAPLVDVEKMRDLAGLHPAIEPLADVASEVSDLMAASRNGGDMWGALDRVREAAAQLPAGHHMRTQLDDLTAGLTVLRGSFGADPDGPVVMPTDDQLASLEALAQRTDLSPADRARYRLMAGGAALGAWQETDPDRIDASIGHFRTALELIGPQHPDRTRCLQGLALGLFRRNELTNSVADLDEAATVLEEARRLAGGPQNPQWTYINQMLASARWRLGGPDSPRTTALEGLRSHTWRVLVQSDLAAANLAARDAAQDAMEVARGCLVENHPADAIRALDAGRALVLFAATGLRDVAGRLADSRPDLATRWRAASASGNPADLPTDLRQEMLGALSAQSTATGLLDPPDLGEVRDALAALDADALVYLVPGNSVPGEAPTPGYAAIAPVTGPPSYMALPNLLIDRGPDVERYLTVLAGRDATLADPARDLSPQDGSAFRDRLDAVCDWAWRAAIGPLLERYLPTVPRSPSGRPPRVVLVPMGGLARIPWQAARRADGTYAVQLAAFSQAASARMLCHSAGLPPVPLAPVGMVVGDPDTGREAAELAAARVEAYAIHQSFYRGARYVGRRADGSPSPSGTGTAQQVRDWLTSTGPAAGAMLHLACHGVIEADPAAATSYLLLAGGDRLTAAEMVDLMGRSPERAVRLVVLAACRTGQAISGYDEAYSLGTAFLAGGARSVLSTQWSIPDRATSVLMFMFHHYLMVERLPAWAALRRAQLWMLDPARVFPDRVPAQLRRQLADADLAGVVAWAGFVHWGQ